MAVKLEEARREATRNFEVFQEKLPKLLETERGKWALLHHAELIAIFDTYEEAGQAAGRLYPDDVYSMQEITDQIVDLGWFSRAPVTRRL